MNAHESTSDIELDEGTFDYVDELINEMSQNGEDINWYDVFINQLKQLRNNNVSENIITLLYLSFGICSTKCLKEGIAKGISCSGNIPEWSPDEIKKDIDSFEERHYSNESRKILKQSLSVIKGGKHE